MAFQLIFLYNERKWRPPWKIRQKLFRFKSTAKGISILKQKYFCENGQKNFIIQHDIEMFNMLNLVLHLYFEVYAKYETLLLLCQ